MQRREIDACFTRDADAWNVVWLQCSQLCGPKDQQPYEEQQYACDRQLAYKSARQRPFSSRHGNRPLLSRGDGDPGHDPTFNAGGRWERAIVFVRVSAQPRLELGPGSHQIATGFDSWLD